MPGSLTNDELREIRRPMATGASGDALRVHAALLMSRAVATGRPMVRRPLGFVCVPAVRRGRTGLCLYIWRDDIAAPALTTSPVHAHTWDLTSHVVHGRMSNHLIRVEDAPHRPTHRVFAVYSDGRVDEIRRTGRLVSRETSAVQAIGAGETYRLPAGRFHATSVTGPAVTMVLADGRHPALELTLGGLRTPAHRVTRNVCGDDERRIVVDAMEACLRAGP